MKKECPILLLGASGYIGGAFLAELQIRGWDHVALSRDRLDYTRFETLMDVLRQTRPSLVINAAGFTGKPNVDACEEAKADTLVGNVLFPQMVACACLAREVPFAHISSGCVYSGSKIQTEEGICIRKDLMTPEMQELRRKNPEALLGFTEEDIPNFSFREPPCSFYSGSKALAEEVLRRMPNHYVWRLRIPFDELDHPRNYLSKIQRYPKVYDNINSLSHRRDFVKACLDLWEKQAPYGIYNMTNPGHVSTREVVELIRKRWNSMRNFEFWEDDGAFYRHAAKTPRSNCVLDVSKLQKTGVRLRPVMEALEEALKAWKPANGGSFSWEGKISSQSGT